MPPQTSTHGPAPLDEIYARVPAGQFARLKEFRRTHPVRRAAFGGERWEYIACGRGRETLLLLPGALSVGESAFPLISAFENEYRVVAPSYPLSQTMTGLCDGIAHVLAAEGAGRAHVLGGSYGGLVAQYFVRRHPRMACSLALMHTFVMGPGSEGPLRLAARLLPALPRALFLPLLRLRLDRMLLSTLRARGHPEYEFWRAYLHEAAASDRFREVALHQNRCLLELARGPRFSADDLKDWGGPVLIIDSDDDPAIRAKERELLRGTYPQARVQTFRDAGHASSILKREETVAVIRDFLARAAAAGDCA